MEGRSMAVQGATAESIPCFGEDAAKKPGASWAACPHAQEQIRRQICALIPGVRHLEVQNLEADSKDSLVTANSSLESSQGAWLKVEVVSECFHGLRPVDQQRLVHRALQAELASGAIHALPELKTLTPEQKQRREAARCIKEYEHKLRSVIPVVEYLEIFNLSDGHTVQGFYDGSRRALDPFGLELELTVVSAAFEGKRPLVRQQLVHEALGPEIMSGKIHALPWLKTWTPQQYRQQQEKKKRTAALPVEGGSKL